MVQFAFAFFCGLMTCSTVAVLYVLSWSQWRRKRDVRDMQEMGKAQLRIVDLYENEQKKVLGRIRNLEDVSSCAIMEISPKTGLVTKTNPMFVEMLGYDYRAMNEVLKPHGNTKLRMRALQNIMVDEKDVHTNPFGLYEEKRQKVKLNHGLTPECQVPFFASIRSKHVHENGVYMVQFFIEDRTAKIAEETFLYGMLGRFAKTNVRLDEYKRLLEEVENG